jgi:acetylornithine deacetylase/succinyl-diaminopimelate desuccinylase-like protein
MIMQGWKDYQEKNKDRFLDELLELLRIPSVSANSDNKEDMRKCAEKVQQRLLEAGAATAKVYETAGHPVVYAEKIFKTNRTGIWPLRCTATRSAEPLAQRSV